MALTTFMASLVTFIPHSALAGNFPDLRPDHKNFIAIEYLVSQGTLQGYNDGTFKPSDTINRAEMMKVLVLGTGKNPSTSEYSNCFSDVKDQWFAPFICYGKQQGWVEGYSDGTFKPSDEVNRAEAVKMITNALNFGWMLNDNVQEKPFNDVEVDDWFASYIELAKMFNMTEETSGNYSPGKGMNRGVMAEMIFRGNVVRNNDDTPYNEADASNYLESNEEEEILLEENAYFYYTDILGYSDDDGQSEAFSPQEWTEWVEENGTEFDADQSPEEWLEEKVDEWQTHETGSSTENENEEGSGTGGSLSDSSSLEDQYQGAENQDDNPDLEEERLWAVSGRIYEYTNFGEGDYKLQSATWSANYKQEGSQLYMLNVRTTASERGQTGDSSWNGSGEFQHTLNKPEEAGNLLGDGLFAIYMNSSSEENFSFEVENIITGYDYQGTTYAQPLTIEVGPYIDELCKDNSYYLVYPCNKRLNSGSTMNVSFFDTATTSQGNKLLRVVELYGYPTTCKGAGDPKCSEPLENPEIKEDLEEFEEWWEENSWRFKDQNGNTYPYENYYN